MGVATDAGSDPQKWEQWSQVGDWEHNIYLTGHFEGEASGEAASRILQLQRRLQQEGVRTRYQKVLKTTKDYEGACRQIRELCAVGQELAHSSLRERSAQSASIQFHNLIVKRLKQHLEDTYLGGSDPFPRKQLHAVCVKAKNSFLDRAADLKHSDGFQDPMGFIRETRWVPYEIPGSGQGEKDHKLWHRKDDQAITITPPEFFRVVEDCLAMWDMRHSGVMVLCVTKAYCAEVDAGSLETLGHLRATEFKQIKNMFDTEGTIRSTPVTKRKGSDAHAVRAGYGLSRIIVILLEQVGEDVLNKANPDTWVPGEVRDLVKRNVDDAQCNVDAAKFRKSKTHQSAAAARGGMAAVTSKKTGTEAHPWWKPYDLSSSKDGKDTEGFDEVEFGRIKETVERLLLFNSEARCALDVLQAFFVEEDELSAEELRKATLQQSSVTDEDEDQVHALSVIRTKLERRQEKKQQEFKIPTDEEVLQFVFDTGGWTGTWKDGKFKEDSRDVAIEGHASLFPSRKSARVIPEVAPETQLSETDAAKLREKKESKKLSSATGKLWFERTGLNETHPSPYITVLKKDPKDSDDEMGDDPSSQGLQEDIPNPYLLRFYFERRLELQRPDVIISVTGGAQNFTLNPKKLNEMMRRIFTDMMQTTKEVSAWFITGGTDQGVMKYIGEAREMNAIDVPVIGIASYGSIYGRKALLNGGTSKDASPHEKVDYMRMAKKEEEAVRARNLDLKAFRGADQALETIHGATLDRNHTHFILVAASRVAASKTDGSSPCMDLPLSARVKSSQGGEDCKPSDGELSDEKRFKDFATPEFIEWEFGLETGVRAAFEASMAKDGFLAPKVPTDGQKPERFDDVIYGVLKKYKVGWAGLKPRFEKDGYQQDAGKDADQQEDRDVLARRKKEAPQDIPIVSVCVQGGAGTVRTVRDAVLVSTPALVVKGSGQAADLIADATLLRFTYPHCPENHAKFLDEAAMSEPQKELLAFLNEVDAMGTTTEPTEGGQPAGKAGTMEGTTERKRLNDGEIMLDARGWNYVWIIEKLRDMTSKVEQGLADSVEERTLRHKAFALLQKYELGKQRKVLELIEHALESANSGKCWVWVMEDVERPARAMEDFTGSLLRCLLNGLGPESEMPDKAAALARKLELAIKWGRSDVLEVTLARSDLWLKSPAAFKKAIDKGFDEALLRDNVQAVETLLKHGADVRRYLFGRSFLNIQHKCSDIVKDQNDGVPLQKTYNNLWVEYFATLKVSEAEARVLESNITVAARKLDSLKQKRNEELETHDSAMRAHVQHKNALENQDRKLRSAETPETPHKERIQEKTEAIEELQKTIDQVAKTHNESEAFTSQKEQINTLKDQHKSLIEQFVEGFRKTLDPDMKAAWKTFLDSQPEINNKVDLLHWDSKLFEVELNRKMLAQKPLGQKSFSEEDTAAGQLWMLLLSEHRTSRSHHHLGSLSRTIHDLWIAQQSLMQSPCPSLWSPASRGAAQDKKNTAEMSKAELYIEISKQRQNLKTKLQEAEEEEKKRVEGRRRLGREATAAQLETEVEVHEPLPIIRRQISNELPVAWGSEERALEEGEGDALTLRKKWFEKAQEGLDAETHQRLVDELHQMIRNIKAQKRVLIHSGILDDLLAPDFQYKKVADLMDPWFDLFIWAVLLSREESALFFWKRSVHPIRSAICASALLRNMALRRQEVPPKMRAQMVAMACRFEDIAVAVQNEAVRLDMRYSSSNVERPLSEWSNQTLLDVAVRFKCERFVEECCHETLDRRFMGDIDPYDQGTNILWLGHVNVPFGSVFFLVLFFPVWIFYADWVTFNPPPRSGCLRHPTQRRALPQGFPGHPEDNEDLKNLESAANKILASGDRHKILEGGKAWAPWILHGSRFYLSSTTKNLPKKKLRRWRNLFWGSIDDKRQANLMTDQTLRELWAPTFTWWQKVGCFWCAPVTIYMCNMIVHIIVVFGFSYFFTSSAELLAGGRPEFRSSSDGGPRREMRDGEFETLYSQGEAILNLLNQTEPETRRIPKVQPLWGLGPLDVWLWEWVMLGYFACSFFTLSSEVLIHLFSSPKHSHPTKGTVLMTLEYLLDPWKLLEATMDLAYFLGFGIRLRCVRDITYCQATIALESLSVMDQGALARLLYGGSLFSLWYSLLRLFSINKRVGQLVITFRRFFADIARWLLMFSIMTFAFGVLMHASGAPTGALHTCSVQQGAEGACVPECADGSGEIRASCWVSWWIMRTIFQSFGEFFLDEMQTDASMYILVICFLFLNVIMLNLLIAMMSSTYASVETEAQRQWMISLFYTTQIYDRLSTALPPPLNVVFIIYDVFSFLFQRGAARMEGRQARQRTLDEFVARNLELRLNEEDWPADEDKERVTKFLVQDMQTKNHMRSFLADARDQYLKSEKEGQRGEEKHGGDGPNQRRIHATATVEDKGESHLHLLESFIDKMRPRQISAQTQTDTVPMERKPADPSGSRPPSTGGGGAAKPGAQTGQMVQTAQMVGQGSGAGGASSAPPVAAGSVPPAAADSVPADARDAAGNTDVSTGSPDAW